MALGRKQYADNVTLTGTGAKNASGNDSSNVLVGITSANVLTGRGGADELTGLAGKDTLSGGLGRDTFHFATGHSGISGATADVITDWSSYDSLELRVAGTDANYRDAPTTATTIGAAATFAEPLDTVAEDSAADTGYLLADPNNDEKFETGIVLTGAGTGGSFGYLDIV